MQTLVPAARINRPVIDLPIITVCRSEGTPSPVHPCMFTVDDTVLFRVVVVIPGRFRIGVAINLELQRVLVPIPVNIDDGVAFRDNRLGSLIRLLVVETGLSVIGSSVHSAVRCINRSRCRSDGPARMYGFDKVIVVTGDVLLPDNNGILCGCNRRPLGVDRGRLADRSAELKLIAGGACSIRIPSTEGITIPHHLEKSLVCGGLSGFDKARCIVCSAFSILVKDEPMAGRRID